MFQLTLTIGLTLSGEPTKETEADLTYFTLKRMKKKLKKKTLEEWTIKTFSNSFARLEILDKHLPNCSKTHTLKETIRFIPHPKLFISKTRLITSTATINSMKKK
jgi:hypothetical protein